MNNLYIDFRTHGNQNKLVRILCIEKNIYRKVYVNAKRTVVHCSACTKDEILEFGRNLVLSTNFCPSTFKNTCPNEGGWASG